LAQALLSREKGVGRPAMSTEWKKPPISQMFNLYDMEAVASKVMTPEGWAYYSSGGDDEITLRENRRAYQRIYFKPRVLVGVANIDLTTTICGWPSKLPFYFTATALGKLANAEAEPGIVKAAHRNGLIYMLPTLSSSSLGDMLKAMAPDQVCFAQLYVNPVRKRTVSYVRELEAGGVKALFPTVDAPLLGHRERDMRFKASDEETAEEDKVDTKVDRSKGKAAAINAFIDPGFKWEDLTWLRSITKLPIYLKGVQCAEDAVLALQAGVQGIVCSNHGGRQLDTARSGVEILAEVIPALKAAGAPADFHVLCDGGVRRASDIMKAVAIGAQGVGLGRAVLYSYAAYGQAGLDKMVDILVDEMTMTMRLLGTPTIKDLDESKVMVRDLGARAMPAEDHLANHNYIPMPSPVSRL